jgi:tetratricopeptide (TPR) repeat protein
MARIRLEQSFDFAAATAYSERALEIDPSLVMAHVTLAGMDLRDLDVGAADAHLDRAAQVDPHDLDLLSVRAAVRFLADDPRGFERAKQAVFAENRTYSKMYTIIAEFADWEHRYPEIVEMARAAVTLNPNDALAHATLGMNLLRMGDEQAGLVALRDAWRRDRFNVHVYNTLNLFDDVIEPDYQSFDAAPFVFRMHESERPVLERLVPQMMQRAYGDMRRRYGFTPEGPLHIELYANPQHFAVRTTGLPNLGVQGVCFGKVITALSPEAGPFNWGQITWHELAHVFHIQLSRNHVPRWFTEGLAEYETIIARPEWRREEDHQLYRAIAGRRLPALRNMNRAFTQARSAEDILTAYYASSQYVKYIVERFGFEKVVVMLRAWGDGADSPTVVQRALGISIDDLDRDFRADVMRRLGSRAADFSVDFGAYHDLAALRQAASAAPNDADAQAALAAGLLVSGDTDGAKRTATAVVGRATNHAVARFVLARIAIGERDARAAEQHLRAILAGGKDGYEIRLLLAQLAMMAENRAAMRAELEAAAHIDPDRPEAWQGLSAVADESNDPAMKARVLERLAQIDQHDREAWNAWMASLEAAQDWTRLAAAGESAQYLDPHNPDVHRRLADAYRHLGKTREANAAAELARRAEAARGARPPSPH